MLPEVILHNCVSVDGRLTGFAPDLGLFYSLVSRWPAEAILAGSETLLQAPAAIPPETPADCEIPPPAPEDKRPLLVVPDSRGRIRAWHHWRKQPYWRDILVLCAGTTPPEYLAYLGRLHIPFVIMGRERVDLKAALLHLNERFGVRCVRVDGGGTLNGVLLRAGLVKEISLLVYPALAGGAAPRTLFLDAVPPPAAGALPCRLKHFEKLKNDYLWLIYEIGGENG